MQIQADLDHIGKGGRVEDQRGQAGKGKHAITKKQRDIEHGVRMAPLMAKEQRETQPGPRVEQARRGELSTKTFEEIREGAKRLIGDSSLDE